MERGEKRFKLLTEAIKYCMQNVKHVLCHWMKYLNSKDAEISAPIIQTIHTQLLLIQFIAPSSLFSHFSASENSYKTGAHHVSILNDRQVTDMSSKLDSPLHQFKIDSAIQTRNAEFANGRRLIVTQRMQAVSVSFVCPTSLLCFILV